jgi:N-formylglutamate amidohydrolase
VAPAGSASSIVATVPHSGRCIPTPFSQTLARDSRTLWADWYTDELYDFLPALGIATIRTDLSRFVADANRDPESGHGGFWSTVVPATDAMGAAVHTRRLTADDVVHRVGVAHAPFHGLVDEAVAGLRAAHERVLLVDLHSFGVPLDVDIVLGDRDGATAAGTAVDCVEQALNQAGYSTARNLRFRGGWIVQRFAGDAAVDAVSIEVNQRCYLDPRDVDAWPDVPRRAQPRLAAARDRLQAAFSSLVAARDGDR